MKTRWENSKSQPWSYSWMLDDIAEMEKILPTKIIKFDTLEKARNAKYKLTAMIFNIDGKDCLCLGSTFRTGGLRVLLFSGFEIPFDSYTGGISVEVRKELKEYQTRPNKAGDYKNCEGGGWYSMASLYEINGRYYTNAY